jgi:hypothetical protein
MGRTPYKKKPSAWLVLSNPITSGALDAESFDVALQTVLITEPPERLAEKLAIVARTSKFKSRFNAFKGNLIEIQPSDVFLTGDRPSEPGWILYSQLIESNRERIQKYLDTRPVIEAAIVMGDYEQALKTLDQLRAEAGDGYWYLRLKILLHSLLGRSEEVNELCQNLQKTSRFIGYMAAAYQLIIGTNKGALLHWREMVGAVVREYTQAGMEDAAAVIGILCSPNPLLSTDDYSEGFRGLQGLQAIDLYEGLVAILRELRCMPEGEAAKYLPRPSTLARIQRSVRDPLLADLTDAQSIESGDCEIFVNQVTALYEQGEYFQVLAEVQNYSLRSSLPLPILTVVAKSLARISPSERLSGEGLFVETVNALSSIYRLDDTSRQAKDDLVSWIIRLHGLPCSLEIQAHLYMALPYGYLEKDVRRAAQLSCLSTKSATPLALQLAGNDAVGFLGRRIGEDSDPIPRERAARWSVQALIEANSPVEEVELALKDVEASAGLQKDLLEIYTTAYFKYNEEERLIPVAARHLLGNYHSHLSLPLGRLVDVIERQRISTLDAAIVCFHYLRYVSSDKDYVLNECVEELLHSCECDRPSEMLASIDRLNEAEAFFFRDICSLEVLDYLSCFSDTDMLRAERVQILDNLLDRGEISTESRMQEVEELVEEAIVEADTNRINGPKIYVDDGVIAKQVHEEIRALYSSYIKAKSSKESDDKLTLLHSASLPNETVAFATGRRSELLVRMFSVVRNAFLFEEMHGLDKNLSTEIRHGFFSNLMRSRLEKAALLTEIDKASLVRPNVYWRDANSFFTNPILNRFDEILYEFSKSWALLLDKTETLMQISVATGEEGINIELSTVDFDGLADKVGRSQSAGHAIEAILSLMWKLVEKQLQILRERLDQEFRASANKLIDELDRDLSEACNDAPRLKMADAIQRSRTLINEDVTTVTEWFQRSRISGFERRSFDHVIRTAVSSFERVKGVVGNFILNISWDVSKISVPSMEVRPVIIAFINLLDNCFRHSGYGRNTKVVINATVIGEMVHAEVINELSAEQGEKIKSSHLSKVNEEIRAERSFVLLRAEGGSGVFKAFNQIKNGRSKNDVILSRRDEQVVAKVIYGN